MASFNRPTSGEAGFVDSITAEVVKRLSVPKPFVIPVLQNDPPTTDSTNLWMGTDGRLRGRYFNGTIWVYIDYPLRSDISSPPAVGAKPAPPVKPPAPRTLKSTWTAQWSQTYQGDGDKRTDSRGNNYLVYGNSGSDSFNGTQRSLVGFDYASMVSNLASSTIKKVELKMTNIHAFWNSGVDIYFGMHNVTSEPSSWPSSGSLLLRRSAHARFGKPQTRTIQLPIAFGQALRAGTGKGLAIEAPSSDRDYYGYAAGFGSGYTPPQLIITYAK